MKKTIILLISLLLVTSAYAEDSFDVNEALEQKSIRDLGAILEDPTIGLQAILDWIMPIMSAVTRMELSLENEEHGLKAIKESIDDLNTQPAISSSEELNTRLTELEEKLDSVEQKLDRFFGILDGKSINSTTLKGASDIFDLNASFVECLEDNDCEANEFCNALNSCEELPKVSFRTNVENNEYFKCSPDDGCWIALDFKGDERLEVLSFYSKTTRCDGGVVIAHTPSGFPVYDYQNNERVRLCDNNGKEIIFSTKNIAGSVDVSPYLMQEYAQKGQETYK